MKTVECPNCGEPVPLFARACGYCGAPNRARLTAIIASTAAASVILAVIVAGLVAFTSGRPPQGEAASPSGRSITGTGDDFAWLSKAMEECDEQAEKESNTLHFLVTPLIDEPRDEPGWRRISLNEIGNAILINGEDMIAGP